MSQANVELVRRAIEAFNGGDFDAALREAVPDVTVDWSHSRGPHPGIYVGHEAVRRFWTEMTEPFEGFTLVPDEFIPFGDYVVAPVTGRMTGRGGIEVESNTAIVAALRDARLARLTMYQNTAEALKAVGMEE
jgi:ketosteroid isomerase-like protein